MAQIVKRTSPILDSIVCNVRGVGGGGGGAMRIPAFRTGRIRGYSNSEYKPKRFTDVETISLENLVFTRI